MLRRVSDDVLPPQQQSAAEQALQRLQGIFPHYLFLVNERGLQVTDVPDISLDTLELMMETVDERDVFPGDVASCTLYVRNRHIQIHPSKKEAETPELSSKVKLEDYKEYFMKCTSCEGDTSRRSLLRALPDAILRATGKEVRDIRVVPDDSTNRVVVSVDTVTLRQLRRLKEIIDTELDDSAGSALRTLAVDFTESRLIVSIVSKSRIALNRKRQHDDDSSDDGEGPERKRRVSSREQAQSRPPVTFSSSS